MCGKQAHTLPRAVAVPATIDFIPPAHLLKFPLVAGLGELALPLPKGLARCSQPQLTPSKSPGIQVPQWHSWSL